MRQDFMQSIKWLHVREEARETRRNYTSNIYINNPIPPDIGRTIIGKASCADSNYTSNICIKDTISSGIGRTIREKA